MNIGNKEKKISILIFFIIIWIGVIYFGYNKIKSLQGEIIQPTEETLTEELFVEQNTDFIPVDDFFEDSENKNLIESQQDTNPDIDDDILAYLSRQEVVNPDPIAQDFFEEIPLEDCGSFDCFLAEEFLDIYNVFEEKTGLEKIRTFIYDNQEADDYIINIAESRGYQARVFADELDIIDFESIRTRQEVRDAYVALRDEMKKEDITLHFVSGYRTAEDQRSIFKNKMGEINTEKVTSGEYDEKLMEVLNVSALPGYSKHHSGYTADFGCGNEYLVYEFATTACYEWMSKNNFENVKRFGFLPSYPNAVIDQGPNPEPWEYVWVGVENINKETF